MREEPVLYINGKPYVVREADQPFCNVEYTGGYRQVPVAVHAWPVLWLALALGA